MSGLELIGLLFGAGGFAAVVNAALAAWQGRRADKRGDRQEDRADDKAELDRLLAVLAERDKANRELRELLDTYRTELARQGEHIGRLDRKVADMQDQLGEARGQIARAITAENDCRRRLNEAERKIEELSR